MARVVLIADSNTGELIDVAGNAREGGRYKKLAGRMLSPAGTQLDYGANGGDSLTISKGGYKGSAINLLANEVNVDGNLKVGGKTVSEMAAASAKSILDDGIVGTPRQVSVQSAAVVDPSTGESRSVLKISLDPYVVSKLNAVDTAIGSLSGVATKSGVADIASGLSVHPYDKIDDIRKTLGDLLTKIKAFAN